MGKLLKKTGLISILESIIFIILGGVLIWKADLAVKMISYILGGVFIVIGLAKVIKYFTVCKENYDFYSYELIFGLMTIVIGGIIMYYSSAIETILRIIIGLWIIYSSFVKFSLSFKLKQIGVKIWPASLVLAVIMFICGLYVILNPGTIIVTIGIAMIIYSIIDIVEDVIYMKNIDDLEDIFG